MSKKDLFGDSDSDDSPVRINIPSMKDFISGKKDLSVHDYAPSPDTTSENSDLQEVRFDDLDSSDVFYDTEDHPTTDFTLDSYSNLQNTSELNTDESSDNTPSIGTTTVSEIQPEENTTEDNQDSEDNQDKEVAKQQKIKEITQYYQDNKSFQTFVNYISALLYLDDVSRYTRNDIREIRMTQLFTIPSVLNIGEFLTFFYKFKHVNKTKTEINNILGKYYGWYLNLLEKLYRKYEDPNFNITKLPDANNEDFLIIGNDIDEDNDSDNNQPKDSDNSTENKLQFFHCSVFYCLLKRI